MTRKTFNALLRIDPTLGHDAKGNVVIERRNLRPTVSGARDLPHAAKMVVKRKSRELFDLSWNKSPTTQAKLAAFCGYWRAQRGKNGVGSPRVRGEARLRDLLTQQELAA